MTLSRQFFSAHLKGLLIWMGVGALLSLFFTRSASTFIEKDFLSTMPPALLNLMGDLGGLSTVDAYLATSIEKGMILLPALYAVMLALSVVTREVDQRTMEFLLALPVQRTQLLLARTAVLLINLTLVVAAIWAVLRFDMAGLGYQGTWSHLALVFINIWLLSVAVAGVTLAASMWIDDYSVGLKLCLGFVTLAFFAEYVLRAAAVSRAGRLLSPFSYADVTGVLREGSIPPVDLAVLLTAILAGAALSFWAFNRKQFSA